MNNYKNIQCVILHYVSVWINTSNNGGGLYLRRSFESLCKKYGTLTKVFIRNGKVIGAYWNKIDATNSTKNVWKVFQCV